tara:strand:- start:6921 stop:7130 length:210 start_codon:yes stop_codon:yes gene_type:complete
MKSEIKIIAAAKPQIESVKTKRIGEINNIALVPESVKEAMRTGCVDIEKLRQIKNSSVKSQTINLEASN